MFRIKKTELARLMKTFVTDVAVAKHLKVHYNTILKYRKKYGIASYLAKNTKRNAKIVALYESGTPGYKIARKFGLTPSVTYRIIKSARRKNRPAQKRPIKQKQ
jgi:Mor family transcriptional regulator